MIGIGRLNIGRFGSWCWKGLQVFKNLDEGVLLSVLEEAPCPAIGSLVIW